VRHRAAERDAAERGLADLRSRLEEAARSAEGLRRDADAFRQQAQADLADTNGRAQGAESALGGQRDRAQQALAAAQAALARCPADNPPCRQARSRAVADARAALGRAEAALSQRLAATDGDRRETRQRRDEAVARKDAAVTEREGEIARPPRRDRRGGRPPSRRRSARPTGAAADRADLVERSQIHRLAEILLGRQDDEAVATTKKWFVLSLAAHRGHHRTVLAAMHFASLRDARPGKLSLALRAYLARGRRRTPVLRQARQTMRRARSAGRCGPTSPVVAVPGRSSSRRSGSRSSTCPLNATEREVALAREQALRVPEAASGNAR
jgi:hypothetical protein